MMLKSCFDQLSVFISRVLLIYLQLTINDSYRFLRTECLFFRLLFVFRIKKISNLLFVTYNKKIYEMLRSE